MDAFYEQLTFEVRMNSRTLTPIREYSRRFEKTRNSNSIRARFGQDSKNLREYSRTFANIREHSRTFANIRKHSRSFENIREASRTFENLLGKFKRILRFLSLLNFLRSAQRTFYAPHKNGSPNGDGTKLPLCKSLRLRSI